MANSIPRLYGLVPALNPLSSVFGLSRRVFALLVQYRVYVSVRFQYDVPVMCRSPDDDGAAPCSWLNCFGSCCVGFGSFVDSI